MPDVDPQQQIKPRLVISDVDGTLVTQEKALTPRAKNAVHRLREAGIKFSITSGRPPRGMQMIIDELQLTEPIAAFNGGIFVNPDLSVIHHHLLDSTVASELVQSISSCGLDVWVYTETDWLVRDPKAPHVAREEWTVKFPPKIVSDFSSVMNDVVKIVGVGDNPDAVAGCERSLQKSSQGRYSASRSQPYYLDVTHPQANKGEVVFELAKLLKISTEEIVTIGDGPNDVLMFLQSGSSIAMGNASSDVQKEAKLVTASNEKDGFAEAMEKFILARALQGS